MIVYHPARMARSVHHRSIEYRRHRRDVRLRVRALRTAAGLTQQDFAKRLGVSQRAVQQWESGEWLPREPMRFHMERIFGQLVPLERESHE